MAASLFIAATSLPAQTIIAAEAGKHIGEKVTVCGKIFGGRYFEKNEKTLLNMGGSYPDNPITIVIDGADRKKFLTKPEETFLNKTVCISGEIKDYKGKPELQVTEVAQIVINEKP